MYQETARMEEFTQIAIYNIKREAIQELLDLHYKKREKISSQTKSLIDLMTVKEYLEGIE